MATSRPWTRSPETAPENLPGNLLGSVLLHAALFGAVLAAALLARRRAEPWGEHAATAGAIQATVVSALPLPPRQKTLDTGVLTSEKPSPAPTPPTPRAEPKPTPKEVPIPTKAQPKLPRVAEKPTPEPPRHPQPAPPKPTKATTGETAGLRIPQATLQLKNGTASMTVEDRTFGARFAYYINIVNRTVAQNWFTQEADPRSSEGRHAVIVFDIDRDGAPSNARVFTRSGSSTLR